MKTAITILICGLIALGLLGCTPEDVQAIGDQVTDPNGPVQQAAEQIGNAVQPLRGVVRAVPGFPFAQAVLGGLAVVEAFIGIILGFRKRTSDKALREVVIGNEALKDTDEFKKSSVLRSNFKTIHNGAQKAPATRLKVAAIRADLVKEAVA